MKNIFFSSILSENIGNAADWKINGVLEYFRYIGILQNNITMVIEFDMVNIHYGIYRIIKKQFIHICNGKS